VVAIVAWLVAIGGLVMFVARRFMGIPLRGPRPDHSERDERAEPTEPTSPSQSAWPAPSANDLPATGLPAPDAPPPSDRAPWPTTAAAAPPSEPAAPPTASDLPSPTDRSGYFAPRPASTPGSPAGSSPATPAGRPTVAEAVAGIQLPCGLAPATTTERFPSPFIARFLTTESDPATVGAGLADELERLGFSLSTSTPTELVARRADAEVRVVLYVNPAAAKRGLDAIFPAAPPGSVGVELST
jgi:hypothetical protein